MDRWGRPPRRARLNRWLGEGRRRGRLEITAVVFRRVELWVHVVSTIDKNFSPIEHISNKNASLQQRWHSKTLSASAAASLRAVGAETSCRSMCFSQVHSHLPDREDVNVLDCITFCDQFFRQNLLNCQTYAPIRKIYVTLHVYAAFVSDSERGNKKKWFKNFVTKFLKFCWELLKMSKVNVK